MTLAERIMPYLHPRFTGIDTLELYTEGFSEYLHDVGEQSVSMHTLEGDAPVEEAVAQVIEQIDAGLPIAMLVLRHRNPRFNFYVWHWFILNGYEKRGHDFRVKATISGRRAISARADWFSLIAVTVNKKVNKTEIKRYG